LVNIHLFLVNDEIYWLDVLLEMLLNLITINTTWIRNSVKALFKKLIPKLRVSSVKLIVDVSVLFGYVINKQIYFIVILRI
jgi:hypothetical protein